MDLTKEKPDHFPESRVLIWFFAYFKDSETNIPPPQILI